jgi:hypothetical protein
MEIDTGAAFIYFNEWEYINFKAQISGIEGMDCSSFNCVNTRTCSDLTTSLETLYITLGAGENTAVYPIPPYGYLEQYFENGNQCQVAVSYFAASNDGVLGSAFLRNYFVEFDFSNSVVSLAANNGNSWNGGAGYTSKGVSVDPNNSGGDPNGPPEPVEPDDNGGDSNGDVSVLA